MKTEQKQTNNSKPAKPSTWKNPTLPGQGVDAPWGNRFAYVPIQLLLDHRVNTSGLQVFCALAVHADPVTGLCGQYLDGAHRTPAQKRLAKLLGVSERTIRNGLPNLIKTGWVKERKQRHNNSLVLWLGMPADLDLVGEDGQFKDLVQSWTEGALPPDKKGEETPVPEPVEPTETSEPAKPASAPSVTPVEPLQVDDAEEFDDPADDLDPLEVTLEDALREYVRYQDGASGHAYTDAEISKFGFAFDTPWAEVYDRYSFEIDIMPR